MLVYGWPDDANHHETKLKRKLFTVRILCSPYVSVAGHRVRTFERLPTTTLLEARRFQEAFAVPQTNGNRASPRETDDDSERFGTIKRAAAVRWHAATERRTFFFLLGRHANLHNKKRKNVPDGRRGLFFALNVRDEWRETRRQRANSQLPCTVSAEGGGRNGRSRRKALST